MSLCHCNYSLLIAHSRNQPVCLECRGVFHGLLYKRTKGLAEEAVKAQGFASASIFRCVWGGEAYNHLRSYSHAHASSGVRVCVTVCNCVRVQQSGFMKHSRTCKYQQ